MTDLHAEALDRLETVIHPPIPDFTALVPGGTATFGDLRVLLALSRRTLASGAGGDEPDRARACLRAAHSRIGVGPTLAMIVGWMAEYDPFWLAQHPRTGRADEAHQPPEPKPAPDHAELVAEAREYRKMATIRAVQYNGQPVDGVCTGSPTCKSRGAPDDATPHIHGLEGDHTVTLGDWIATGIQGERWAIKPDIFETTYALADALASVPSGEVEALRLLVKSATNDAWKRVAENARLREAVARAATTMDLGRRFIESGQVVDKDLRGHLMRGRDEARTALAPADGEG